MTKQTTSFIILLTAVFNHAARVCFRIKSGENIYIVCFDKGKGVCSCDGNAIWHKQCKHIKTLAPIAAQKLAERDAKAARKQQAHEEAAQPAASIGEAMADADTALRIFEHEQDTALEAAYEIRGAEIEAAKREQERKDAEWTAYCYYEMSLGIIG